jgi:putative DNA methylase
MTEPYRKKLIEVALPLEAISEASRREKNPFTKNHPRAIHVWWSRKPLVACRAVLFASIVDDPSSRPDLFPTEDEQEIERQRLFRIIEELVRWENTTNETVLEAAREEIRRATEGTPPPVLDPFCGGGSIPLEAQRLGLEAHASDLNPVAVLITKALIEIPPKVAGQPPVNPESRAELAHGATWKGAQGLAEDVRHYGRWMRERALERIGHLYPKATLKDGGEKTVIAWLWTRTVRCPNPACAYELPLVNKWMLSTKKGKEAYVHPLVDRHENVIRFEVRSGRGEADGTVNRRGATCLVCGAFASFNYVRDEAQNGRMDVRLKALVTQGDRTRVFLSPDAASEAAAQAAEPSWRPEVPLVGKATVNVALYGLSTQADLFTPRQLLALTTLSDLVREARQVVIADCGDVGYGDAVATYLGLASSRFADFSSALSSWDAGNANLRQLFARQALPMAWDFVETNPFDGVVSILDAVGWTANAVEHTPASRASPGVVRQLDGTASVGELEAALVCTDPPYYDNIGYGDIADFFYTWLRSSLRDVYPDLLSTLASPKDDELVATPYRFGGNRAEAKEFFEVGIRRAFRLLRESQDERFPMTLFYAFKQAESVDGNVASTGWDAMLTGLLESGFAVTGTWPMRTEQAQRSVGISANALASSIMLVCRPRSAEAPIGTRRELVGALRGELPSALRQLQHGSVAPVDLAQAAIGPGMAVFSRYAKVLEADGTPMSVRSALALINQALDEILAEQEGDFDADTRFAVTWFEERGFQEGSFGEADVLARAKDTSTSGLEAAGVLESRAGKVRLLRRDELPEDWDPVSDRRPTVWEATQHLARRLESDGGETAAAELLRRLGGLGETARELAYRLYTTCERKGWAQDALAYNALVVAWPEIARLVAGTPEAEAQQAMEL